MPNRKRTGDDNGDNGDNGHQPGNGENKGRIFIANPAFPERVQNSTGSVEEQEWGVC